MFAEFLNKCKGGCGRTWGYGVQMIKHENWWALVYGELTAKTIGRRETASGTWKTIHNFNFYELYCFFLLFLVASEKVVKNALFWWIYYVLKNISVIKIFRKLSWAVRALIMLCSLATAKSNMMCTQWMKPEVMQLNIRVNYFFRLSPAHTRESPRPPR